MYAGNTFNIFSHLDASFVDIRNCALQFTIKHKVLVIGDRFLNRLVIGDRFCPIQK